MKVCGVLVLGFSVAWALVPRPVLSHGAVTTTVLFDREIVRILNSRCVACHMDGGIAFPLSTYEQTWVRGRSIRTEILRHHMPPWAAISGYGEFVNENGLTLRETQFLVSWVEGLGPRNAGTVFLNVSDPQARAREEVRAVAHVGHWQLGDPDLVRPLEASRVEVGQGDFVRRSIIDPGLTSARGIRAVEYLPGDRHVVRAVVFSVQQTGQWLGSWTPWYGFTRLPRGVGVHLAPGSRITADVYYRSTNERVVDRGSIGLFFADRADARTRPDLVLNATNDASGVLRATVSVTSDTHVWALRPAIDGAVASLEVSARRADGGTDILLYARDVSTAWPTPYILKQPVLVRRGTQISFVARMQEAATGKAVRMVVARY